MLWEIEEEIFLVRERCTENRETMLISLKKEDAGFTKINQILRVYVRLDTSNFLNTAPSLTLHTHCLITFVSTDHYKSFLKTSQSTLNWTECFAFCYCNPVFSWTHSLL